MAKKQKNKMVHKEIMDKMINKESNLKMEKLNITIF
jgi:hypothetical protein